MVLSNRSVRVIKVGSRKSRIRTMLANIVERLTKYGIIIRDFWAPVPKHSRQPGSLYEFILQEELRQQMEAKLRIEQRLLAEDKLMSRSHINLSQDTPNYPYLSHCMINDKILSCTFAAEDVDNLFHGALDNIYTAMATWMGKPPPTELEGWHNYLTSDLPVGQVLSNIKELMSNLEVTNPKLFSERNTTDEKLPLEVIHPLFLELGKLSHDINGLKESMSQQLEDISPVLSKFVYDERLYSQHSKLLKPYVAPVASVMIYESSTCYDNIQTEDSVSTLSMTPIPGRSSKQKFVSELRKIWNFFRCIRDNDGETEIIMSPSQRITRNPYQTRKSIESEVENSDSINIKFRADNNREPCLEESVCEINGEDNAGKEITDEGPQNSRSMVITFSCLKFETPKVCEGLNLISEFAPPKSSSEGLQAFIHEVKSSVSRMLGITKEDVHLENTTQNQPISFKSDDPEESSQSTEFPEPPTLHFVNSIQELRKIVKIATKIISNIEKKFNEFPFEGMKSDANLCFGISDLLQIMFQKGEKLEILKTDEVYQEEMKDVKIVMNRAYKSGIKFVELLEEYKEMVKTDETFLWSIIRSYDPNLQNGM